MNPAHSARRSSWRIISNLLAAMLKLGSRYLLSLCSQSRHYHHSVVRQRFYTNKTHKKVCPQCKKQNALLHESCTFCQEELLEDHIKLAGRDAQVRVPISFVPLLSIQTLPPLCRSSTLLHEQDAQEGLSAM